MSVFNLRAWLKQSAKKREELPLTEKQLRDVPEKAKLDNDDITEKKLESYRVEDDPKITEQRLEKVRAESEHITTEGRLDKAGKPHRDDSTHCGDVPKLEEKRLSGKVIDKPIVDPSRLTDKEVVEEQIPELASKMSEDFRIEKMKSGNDSLKLASTKKKAQKGSIIDEENMVDLSVFDPDIIPVTEEEEEIEEALSNFNVNRINELEEIGDWEEMKRDILLDGDAVQQLFDEQSTITSDKVNGDDFLSGQVEFEIDQEVLQDSDGALDLSSLREAVVGFLRKKHPEFIVTEDNLDLSQVEDGLVRFLATEMPIG